MTEDLSVLNEKYLCPDCGSPFFLLGPSGGMAQNIKCADAACGSTFWFAPPFSPERIEDAGSAVYSRRPINLRNEIVPHAPRPLQKRWWEFWK